LISELIQDVLDLQPHHVAENSEQMQLRRNLVERLLKKDFEQAVFSLGREVPYEVGASHGVGSSARVPWVRVFDPEISPKAAVGWYVVLLFAADGSAAFLSLNFGVTGLSKAAVADRRALAMNFFSTDAKRVLSAEQALRYSERISLADPGQYGPRYESGNIAAFAYSNGIVPTSQEIVEDLAWLLDRLETLPGGNEMASTGGGRPEPQGETTVQDLASQIGLSLERTVDIVDSLRDASPQIVLTGPPGTGKTFVAQKIAAFLLAAAASEEARNDLIHIVQFHPSYGYEEFVEGLRPAPSDKGVLEFKPVGGILTRIVDEMNRDGMPRVMILDEMNRANLARVFGELMFLLEYRDQAISLLHRDYFKLPRNLFIIGTMNTADRSAKAIDIALRRRFDFFELPPSVDVLRRHYSIPGNVNHLGEGLYDGFEALNSQIEARLGERHYQVGHSFFLLPEMDGTVLRKLWNHQLFPLIEEYFFDRPEIARDFLIGTFWRDA
jgi:hypothetical protein